MSLDTIVWNKQKPQVLVCKAQQDMLGEITKPQDRLKVKRVLFSLQAGLYHSRQTHSNDNAVSISIHFPHIQMRQVIMIMHKTSYSSLQKIQTYED